MFLVACLDFLLLSSYLIVVLRRFRLFTFPSFSQWYKEKGDWREEIAGAGEVERASVCLCIIIDPSWKEGVISVSEVTSSHSFQASLRLWRQGPPLLSLYYEPLELIQLLTCLPWNGIIFIWVETCIIKKVNVDSETCLRVEIGEN